MSKDETKTKNERQQVVAPSVPEELKGFVAEFPEWAEIVAGANYDSTEPKVEDPDPRLRYYWAAPDRYTGHPGNVTACLAKGYRISHKKTVNPTDDCVLMETPIELYELRMRKEQEGFHAQVASVKRAVSGGEPDKGLEALSDRRGIDNQPPGVRRAYGE